jgi:hypothetical protein
MRQMAIEILYHGKWMAKTHHYLANLSQKKHFSPTCFHSEILQLVEKKKQNFVQNNTLVLCMRF